jgi:hypothetical protein
MAAGLPRNCWLAASIADACRPVDRRGNNVLAQTLTSTRRLSRMISEAAPHYPGSPLVVLPLDCAFNLGPL